MEVFVGSVFNSQIQAGYKKVDGKRFRSHGMCVVFGYRLARE